MIFGWESNKVLMKKYMMDHAEDIGRFWAEMCLESPTIFLNFYKGFTEEVMKGNPTKKE